MPSLQAASLDINPSADPIHYPGRLVDRSSLVAASWIYELQPKTGERLGEWLVIIDGGPLERHRSSPVSLDEALRLAGVAPMDNRYPILAVGSNASPGQLRHKFGAAPDVSTIVPMTKAVVSHVGIGHSAHVSKAGYVPYVPLMHRDAKRTLYVLWMDSQQVSLIDKTEPNYHPTFVSGVDFPAVLESGEALRVYGLYRGRWGTLRLRPGASPIEATTQTVIFDLLRGQPWFLRLIPEEATVSTAEVIRALGADTSLRDRVREAMARESLAGPDGLPTVSLAALSYASATAT